MNTFVSEDELDDILVVMDYITICGMTKHHHDENLGKFQEAAKCRNLIVLNEMLYISF